MSLILKCGSIAIDSKNKHLIQASRFDFSWELAANRHFKDTLFTSKIEIDSKGEKSFKTLAFNINRNKIHFLNQVSSQDFINKYYADKKITDRTPSFYLFNIPLPNIEYEVENSSISGEDRYNIIVSKFREKTYQNIERYRVRIEIPNTFDFRDNPFRPIFQTDFQDIHNLSESYKQYLSKFLNVEPVRIKTENLIKPFYLLNADEVIEINSIQNEIESNMHEEMIKESQESEGEEYSKWERSVIDEMNGEAFEFDPDNYWNID